MTLRYMSWPLDLIVGVSFLSVAISLWLLWATRKATAESKRRHLIGAEWEFIDLPLSGALFRLVQQLAFTGFALVLWLVTRPGLYPVIALYVIGQGSIPVHSFLMLSAQRRALRKIPPRVNKGETTP